MRRVILLPAVAMAVILTCLGFFLSDEHRNWACLQGGHLLSSEQGLSCTSDATWWLVILTSVAAVVAITGVCVTCALQFISFRHDRHEQELKEDRNDRAAVAAAQEIVKFVNGSRVGGAAASGVNVDGCWEMVAQADAYRRLVEWHMERSNSGALAGVLANLVQRLYEVRSAFKRLLDLDRATNGHPEYDILIKETGSAEGTLDAARRKMAPVDEPLAAEATRLKRS